MDKNGEISVNILINFYTTFDRHAFRKINQTLIYIINRNAYINRKDMYI